MASALVARVLTESTDTRLAHHNQVRRECAESAPRTDWPIATIKQDETVPPNSNFGFTERLFKYKSRTGVRETTLHIEQKWVEEGLSCVVWPAAEDLATYLAELDIAGKKVVELGCGCALPSLVATKVGSAKFVLATDRETVLGCTRRNVNGNTAGSALEVAVLDWTNSTQIDFIAAMGPWDLVIGADLVYAEELFEPLEKVLKTLVAKKTTLLLAGKKRYIKRWRKFKKRLVGFSGGNVLSSEGAPTANRHRGDSYLYDLHRVGSVCLGE